ncbi:MAG: FAD:protein FMN transferase [Heyndrickxia sp.]
MDTVVEIQVLTGSINNSEVEGKINSAFAAFRNVEEACSRFTLDSELMKVSRIIGKPIPVSPYLFEPLKFALEVASFTDGLFDPTVGKRLEDLGFNRHYLTGKNINSYAEDKVNYKNIVIDEMDRTVLFQKSMVIDLGAVAKGFAIDLAVNCLRDFDGFMINAGGDIYAGGVDEKGDKWRIGIQHPFDKNQILYSIDISDEAICTSGGYERISREFPGQHHIINPYSKQSPNGWVSCSVIAPYAMMADAFSTTAFLLDQKRGEEIMNSIGIRGLFITPELQIKKVGGDKSDH